MATIMTFSELQDRLPNTGSYSQVFLSASFEDADNYVINYCNLSGSLSGSFYVSPTTGIKEDFSGLKTVIADMVKFQLKTANNVTSETIGGYSVSYGSNYPAQIYQMMRPYRKIKWVDPELYVLGVDF